MKFCHIVPTDYLQSVGKFSTCFLSLAHLIEQDQAYVDYHLQLYKLLDKQNTKYVKIMDNSGYEFFKIHGPGYVFDPDKLLPLAEKINAEYVVMPDYPGEHADKTIEQYEKYHRTFIDNQYKTFFCPQSESGNLKQYIDCWKWAIEQPTIGYIGLSILAAPLAFGIEHVKFQRYLARFEIMEILYDEGILDKIKTGNKKIHFLGMLDGPNEISLVRKFHSYIDSWDSSIAGWAGINDVVFDNSPTGLINGKVELPVDFSAKYDESKIPNILLNIQYMDEKINNNETRNF